MTDFLICAVTGTRSEIVSGSRNATALAHCRRSRTMDVRPAISRTVAPDGIWCGLSACGATSLHVVDHAPRVWPPRAAFALAAHSAWLQVLISRSATPDFRLRTGQIKLLLGGARWHPRLVVVAACLRDHGLRFRFRIRQRCRQRCRLRRQAFQHSAVCRERRGGGTRGPRVALIGLFDCADWPVLCPLSGLGWFCDVSAAPLPELHWLGYLGTLL